MLMQLSHSPLVEEFAVVLMLMLVTTTLRLLQTTVRVSLLHAPVAPMLLRVTTMRLQQLKILLSVVSTTALP